MIQMRRSRVLELLRSGKKVTCIKINLADPRACALAALSGFDCIWVDQEHVSQNWSALEAAIWATKAYHTDLLVRVPRGAYNNYIKPLELDATGIMVPHIMSLADAKEIVHHTRFYPVGRRAIDGGNADGAYTGLDFNQYLKDANEQRFVIIQIEDPEPLDELEAIAALPGYDMLFFGPGDFSQGIGAPGEWDHPLIAETRKRIADTAKRHNKFAGTVGSPANVKELNEMGYQFVSIGADVVGLKNYFTELLRLTDSSSSAGGNSYLEKQ